MGQDIAEYGGVFKVTEGFVEKFGEADKRSLLQALGCRATRDDMCEAYDQKRDFLTAGVAYTLFGLALCDSGVRDELGGGFEPFEVFENSKM